MSLQFYFPAIETSKTEDKRHLNIIYLAISLSIILFKGLVLSNFPQVGDINLALRADISSNILADHPKLLSLHRH